MLTTTGRIVRSAATVAVLLALFAGSIWGDDDHFPFGPFRMYSTTNEVNGEIRILRLDAVTSTGEERTLAINDTGLRRAELDGQIARFAANPGLLKHLATAYERRRPDAPELAQLQLVFGIHTLENREPVSYHEEVVAEWQR